MHRRWTVVIVACLVTLVVLPHQWLAGQWAAFASVFNPFCLNVGHTAGHLLVFAVLSTALVLAVPALRRRAWLLVPLILLIGIGQECAQLIHKQRLPGPDEAHDLSMDLIAAGSVAGIVGVIRRSRERR